MNPLKEYTRSDRSTAEINKYERQKWLTSIRKRNGSYN